MKMYIQVNWVCAARAEDEAEAAPAGLAGRGSLGHNNSDARGAVKAEPGA